jgi:hypothetical protein
VGEGVIRTSDRTARWGRRQEQRGRDKGNWNSSWSGIRKRQRGSGSAAHRGDSCNIAPSGVARVARRRSAVEMVELQR